MGAHHKTARAAIGRPSQAIAGIVPAGLENRILLALRAAPMLQPQLSERFGSPSGALTRLERLGYITKPGPGRKGEAVTITAAGRDLLEQHSGLRRRATEIVYCQL